MGNIVPATTNQNPLNLSQMSFKKSALNFNIQSNNITNAGGIGSTAGTTGLNFMTSQS